MSSYIIAAEDLFKKKGQFFDDLITYLDEKLPRYITISVEGSNIVTSSERDFSKRLLRQLVRKHLHNARLKGELKIIAAAERDEYIIKKRKGIELEIEEPEEEF